MALADLTSPGAVANAVEEFDRLGREAFLAKYGFGRAREYFLEVNGKLYDSKAIAGVAHAFQFPDTGPLRPSEVSGGDATVRAVLEGLGYKVVVREQPTVGPHPGSADLEKAFHQRMINIYLTAKTEVRYNATRFLAMVNEHGGVATARMLLSAPGVSEGYAALWERQRLDLTVEAVVLEEQWRPLFSAAERQTAIARLREYHYTGQLPNP